MTERQIDERIEREREREREREVDQGCLGMRDSEDYINLLLMWTLRTNPNSV